MFSFGGELSISKEYERLGAPDEFLEAVAPKAFEVDPDNWDALMLFLRIQTQWYRSPMSGLPVGLNYSGVEAFARLAKIDITAEMLAALQILEMAFMRESTKKPR